MENMQLLGIALRQRKCLTAIADCQRLAETRGRAILYKPCLFPWFEGGFVCYCMANLRVPLQGTPETDLCSLPVQIFPSSLFLPSRSEYLCSLGLMIVLAFLFSGGFHRIFPAFPEIEHKHLLLGCFVKLFSLKKQTCFHLGILLSVLDMFLTSLYPITRHGFQPTIPGLERTALKGWSESGSEALT